MSQQNIADFFAPESNQFTTVKALGFESFDIDGNKFARLYRAVSAQPDDTNRRGIIPQTVTVKPELVPVLDRVESWPAVLECEIASVPGAKNRAAQIVVNVKGVGLGSDKPQASQGK